MKKVFPIIGVALLVAAGGVYLFREQLWEVTKKAITADMFIAADLDEFDPGLPIGASFPAIKVLYQGQEISEAGGFIHDKGMVFIANRSADW